MTQAVIQTLGESALVLNAGVNLALSYQLRLWVVASQARNWPHVIDVVPGMNNVTLLFDPLQADIRQLTGKLQNAWDEAAAVQQLGREIEIPVSYGGDYGPDLADVARSTGFSAKEVVKRHAAAEYVVYFIGFQPGFPYLGGLDPALSTPRRSEPRLAVPAGSVGIGGSQTGIYPAASPGGWQLIGHSDINLFDPHSHAPTLLQPGDRVRFIAREVLL
ncbi:5-oxoprolinase subunit PxpB [Budvicia diplopodorum]|uniref:5-oxoprolinase subunit PxpB n=1 Tax=Budvicia diplopodorum TaxID=1119056 RepID=UPI001358613C|nr:5-oxoprolinase subunit PxpB [Budvicia diplopodorum]